MSKTSAIIFDLDGTLIDSAPAIHAIANRAMAAKGFPPLDAPTVQSFVGRGVPHLIGRLLSAHGADPDGPLAAPIRADFLRRYETEVEGNTLFPGVAETLDHLRAAGHRLGICTNKPHAAALAALDHVGLGGCFGAVVGGDSLPTRKPDPAMLHHTLAALGGGPVLYVGDSAVDAETAVNARVPFALYTLGYRNEPVEALPHQAAFDDWREFPRLVSLAL